MSTLIFYFDDLFDTTYYPSGEFHIKFSERPSIKGLAGEIHIIFNAIDFNGLMKCLVADKLLTQNDIDPQWVIPFAPFARDDRGIGGKDGMELDYALEILEKLNAVVVDPHSDVTGYSTWHFPQDDVVREFASKGMFLGDPVIAIPDAGAAKKAYSWITEHNLPYVQCFKRRDTETGKLSGFQIVDNGTDLENKDIVIVDDICDGGGTFIGLAKEFEADDRCRSLTLAVTHGLFTKGVGPLIHHFSRIYTLDHFGSESRGVIYGSLQNIIREGTPR